MKHDSMDNKLFFKKAYKILETLTPLPVDCGKLCDGACCEGDDDMGMLLFPGEESLFEGLDGFIIKDTEFALSDGYQIKLLICTKNCDRTQRPLACRIFPLFGFVSNNKMKIVVDPRAYTVCPLSIVGIEEGFTPEFIAGVENTFNFLFQNSRCKDFIEIMKEELLLEDERNEY